MKQNSKFTCVIIISIFFFTNCTQEIFIDEINDKKGLDDSAYQTINLDSQANLCDVLSSLSNYTIVNLASTTYSVDCDININNSFVIINGNEATLKYMVDSIRINIFESNNITIKNLTIDNNNAATWAVEAGNPKPENTGRIKVIKSSNILIESIKMNAQKQLGNFNQSVHQILFKETVNSTVKKCSIYGSEGELIFIKGSSLNIVRDNYLEDGWSGVGTIGINNNLNNIYGYDNQIIKNEVVNSTTAYITINDRRAKIDSNKIYSTNLNNFGGPGIRFGHINGQHTFASGAVCTNNEISNLLINANPYGHYEAVAIKVDFSNSNESNEAPSDLIIRNNIITNCTMGIKVSNQEGQYMHIKENDISTIDGAIFLYSSDSLSPPNKPQFAKIEQNTLRSRDADVIKIHNSYAEIIKNNIYSDTDNKWKRAIYFQNLYVFNYPTPINIIENIIELNKGIGIYYNGNNVENANIHNNIISNGNLGIYFGGSYTSIWYNSVSNFESWSVYLRYGASNAIVAGNTIKNPFKSSVYLHNNFGAKVYLNDFEYTAGGFYPWAVWKNPPDQDGSVFNNSLTNFNYQSN